MLSAIAEGGIVVSKVIKDKRALSQQLMLYREFVRAGFLGT
jgi:TetR/AcrR family transcriptional regulator, transcriptional repressor for nem operon